MKKVIILVGLTLSFSLRAESYQRSPISEFKEIENMYAAFEVVTPKYEKVILDCQSFIHGMNFYYEGQLVREIKMVNYSDCESVAEFIGQSLENHLPVCMEIEEESNALNFSNDEADYCQ